MANTERDRIPVTPTILVVAGIIVGIVGIVMLILGLGGSAPTTLQVPGMNLNVSTTSLAVVVTVLGLGVSLSTVAMTMRYSKGLSKEERETLERLAKERPTCPLKTSLRWYARPD